MPLTPGIDSVLSSFDRQGITNQSHHEILSVALFYGLDSLPFLFLEIKKQPLPLGLGIDPGLCSLDGQGEAVHDHHDVGVNLTQQQTHDL